MFPDFAHFQDERKNLFALYAFWVSSERRDISSDAWVIADVRRKLN